MTWVVLVGSGLLAGVAAAGVLRPFAEARREGGPPWADPMGTDAGEAPGHRGEVPHRQGRLGRSAALILVSAIVIAALVPLLAQAARERAPGQPITGGVGTTDPDDLAFFEERVREHPDDVAARLDLGRRYMDRGDVRSAIRQYVAALELDPDNPEARATLGFLLYLAGEPQEGLASVEEALATDPAYPEGLYFMGVILLHGLDRPEEAATAFRAYLEAAPFGAHRQQVDRLLEEAER
jgi:cytochrome c-type biogenesis protein CcmH/NrfG